MGLMEQSGATLEECVDVCFALVVPLGAIVTRQLSLVIDSFLEHQHRQVLNRIIQLVQGDQSPAGDAELSGYIYDAMRIRGIVQGLPRIALSSGTLRETKQQGRVDYKVGNTVIANLHDANHDAATFKEPMVIMSDRKAELYGCVGCAPYLTFGNEAILPVMLAVVKEVFKLPNLRRGAVNGKLSELSEGLGRNVELSKVYLDQRWNETHSPTTMTVEYDVDPTITSTATGTETKATTSATTTKTT